MEYRTMEYRTMEYMEFLMECHGVWQRKDQSYLKCRVCWSQGLGEKGVPWQAVSLILCYKNHLEWTTFCVTNLGKQKLILGHSWLCKHNPEIDWAKGEIKMSRCSPHCCSGCRDELRQERIVQKTEAKRKDACSVGPSPEIDHDLDYDSDSDSVPDSLRSKDETISME